MKAVIGSNAKGSKELKKHNGGGVLTRRQAIYAKCYDCMGRYADGKNDCDVSRCPLYSYMPYRGKKRGIGVEKEVTEALALT